MYGPKAPHAGRKMRIEMAVEDRVANCLVAVAAPIVIDLERKGRTGTDHLAVEIGAVVVVGTVQPLVRMLMMHVRQVRSGMEYSEDDVIVKIAVIDVGWIVGVVRSSRFRHRVRRANRWWFGSSRLAVLVSLIRLELSG